MPRFLLPVLRSPRLALGVLGFLTVYCGIAAWLPWSAPGAVLPRWAVAVGLHRPFASAAFLAAIALLFLGTLACLWDRTLGTLRLWRGREPSGSSFESRPCCDFEQFLREEGFEGKLVLFRYRHALWGGWVLHLGIAVLIAGVAVQQAYHDGGAFELSEGERVVLSAPGVVFARERGPFAPETPPDLALGLVSFDPFLHETGYAPDRASRLRIELPGRPPTDVALDRAQGTPAGRIAIYHAIPAGLALNLEVAGLGPRSFHLRARSPLAADGEFVAPGGQKVRLLVTGERALDDPRGTGPLVVWVEQDGRRHAVVPGLPFAFGQTEGRLLSICRWAGYTYARSPGIPAVFAGFALALLGAALLVFPAGVAWPQRGGSALAGRAFVTRGRELLLAEWARRGQNPPGTEA